MYATLKLVHIGLAVISVLGFILRGILMLRDSALLNARFVRIAPHIIDSVFLISGVCLVLVLRLQLSQHHWLWAKLLALVVYVVLGSIALRRGRTKNARLLAFAASLAVIVYIVGAALTKSALSWGSFL